MADWNSRQSPARPNNKGNFEPQPVPPFSGAAYSSSDSSLVPYNNGANQMVAAGPSYPHPPPRFYNTAGPSNAYMFSVIGNMMRQYSGPGNGYNNNGRVGQYSMTGPPPPPPNFSQAIIDNITQKVREEEQNKTKKGFEKLGNTIKELSCKLAAAETLLKKQDEVIQNSRRKSSSPNTSDALIPDINEEEHRENEKLKEKLKNLEVENHQLRHAKADVSRLQEILKTENQKLEAMVKEKNSMDLKLQDSEKKLNEEKATLAKVNVSFKLELQRIKMEKEQNAKILSPGTPGEDSKDIQIKKLQDALESEKKNTAESQAQCAKEKEKISDLEHQLHQKMKEIQDLEVKDVVSTEVQTDPMSTESDDKTSVDHTKSLQIRIHELVAVKNVMRGELRKLKRKFSKEDGKTDDLSKSERKKKKKYKAGCKDDGNLEKQELKERSSEPKPIDTTANDEKSEVKDKDKAKRTGGIAKDDKKMEQKDGKSGSSSDPKPVDTATNDEKSEVKDGDKVKESNEVAKEDQKKKEQKVRRSVCLSAKKPIASTKDEKKLKEKESDGISEVKKKKSSSDKEPDTAAKDKQKSDKTPEAKMEKKKAIIVSSDSSSDESIEKLAPKPIKKRGRPPKNPENSGEPKPKKMKHIE